MKISRPQIENWLALRRGRIAVMSLLGIALVLLAGGWNPSLAGEEVTVDGVLHVRNSAEPADGTETISLKEAMCDLRLVRAMHEQLTPAILRGDQAQYTAGVRYKGSVVYIAATFKEWKWFFQVDNDEGPLKG